MAIYNPPTENLPIFNARVFVPKPNDGLTTAEGDLRYLRFPAAQGSELLQDINVIGVATFSNTTLPTSTAVLPLSTDSSTLMPTTNWVQQAIGGGTTSLLASANTWTNQNDFTITSNAAYSIPTFSNIALPNLLIAIG